MSAIKSLARRNPLPSDFFFIYRKITPQIHSLIPTDKTPNIYIFIGIVLINIYDIMATEKKVET